MFSLKPPHVVSTIQKLRAGSVAADATSSEEPQWLPALRRQVEGLRFGAIQVVVHDGRVVQIERTEKTRFDAKASHLA